MLAIDYSLVDVFAMRAYEADTTLRCGLSLSFDALLFGTHTLGPAPNLT